MSVADEQGIELEPPAEAGRDVSIRPIGGPKVPEPPPVRLIAVEDVHLPAPADDGTGTPTAGALDALYVELLGFRRKYADGDVVVYHAENARLFFDLAEPPIGRESLRPTGVEVDGSLGGISERLIEAGVAFTFEASVPPAQPTLLLRDPAGNWLAVTARRELR